MNREKLWYVLITYCVIVLFVGICMDMEKIQAKERQEIDLSLTPNEMLFDVVDMKPGDWKKRSIHVSNKQGEDFSYFLNSEFNEGSVKLYNALQLEIRASDQLLYKGSLSGFTKKEKRILGKGKNEELQCIVRFPEELGNDYQGLKVNMKFVFYAEDSRDIVEKTDSGKNDISNRNEGNGNTDRTLDHSYVKQNKLPSTGSLYGDIMLILLGSGLIIVAILLWRKRIRE
ncbi:hypothetical protein SAMN04488168_10215 [Bacillus sp. 491mf]|uniref:LPXTG cell wall anchor domain-containing protein n=1 Tax=Bacillus TaxID=1386 RepID=UPI00068BEF23|nr:MULTISPECIES: LPXTG cell wall anchor domain-containing protein [unclassified Bacillus (in: firmicutes)]SFC09948.1 hypothetical protein SAMN04488168_10215 [Bacillus sp. 491mf]